jgi:hypothetical protein
MPVTRSRGGDVYPGREEDVMQTMRTNPLLALSAIIVAGLAPAPAGAQSAAWSVTGAGCVPTGQTAAGPGTFNSAGDAGFPAGRVGEIILTCPVPPTVGRVTGMSVTYRDVDGPGAAVRLRAVLRQKNLATGAVADAGGVLDSNGFAASNATVRRGIALGNPCVAPFVFDHGRFTYYIQVNMTRSGATRDVLLASVELGNSTLC